MANSNSNKVLQVRLQEKIDLATNWANKEATFVPLKGEKIVYQVDTGVTKTDKNGSATKVYETISKTGDGVHYLKDLPYDEAVAADVAGWAKPEDDAYVNVPDELASIKNTAKTAISAISGNGTTINYTKTDGSTGSTSISDTRVAQTLTTGSAEYPILLKYTNTATDSPNAGARYGAGITVNPSTKTVKATKFIGNLDGKASTAGTADNAGQANKLTTDAGSTTQPVYFANGVPVAIGYTIQSDVPANAKFTDTNTKVTQTNDTSTNSDFPLLIKNSANTTTETEGVKSASKVTINPSTGKVATSGDIAGANITASGTVTADSVSAGTMSATTFTGALSGKASTAGTADKTKAALTFGSKTFNGSTAQTITAADLGISAPLDFVGTTTTALTDGATTNPIKVNNANYTAVKGDVVLYGDKEFLFTGSAWEELGDASALADAVSGIKNIAIDAGAELTWSGTLGNTPKIDHDVKLSGGFTGGSAATTVTAGAGTKTIKIPKLTVNQYGHVTGASEVDLKITVPSIPTLSGGSAAAADATVVGGVSVDGHTVTVQKKTVGVANTNGVLQVTGDASNVKIGFKAAGANDVLFGDETWHGHDSYIVLCGGSASENI